MPPEPDKRIPAASSSCGSFSPSSCCSGASRSSFFRTQPHASPVALWSDAPSVGILRLGALPSAYRTISYGLSLVVHTMTVVVSWRQLFDPWGLAKVGSHLWISTWPTWAPLPHCS